MTQHRWRQPAFSSDPSGPRPDNAWLKFVTDSHLELLMELVDQQRRGQRLSKEDSHYYIAIKEQAEEFMAQAKREHWSQQDRRDRMLAWHSSNLAGR